MVALAGLPLALNRRRRRVEGKFGKRDSLDLDIVGAHEDHTTVRRPLRRRKVALRDWLAAAAAAPTAGGMDETLALLRRLADETRSEGARAARGAALNSKLREAMHTMVQMDESLVNQR